MIRILKQEEHHRAHEASPEIEEFLSRCTSCGSCSEACGLLRSSGTPAAVLSRKDENVFLCTGCGACAGRCPEGLNPSEAFLYAKHRILRAGQVSEKIAAADRAARRFAAWGHSFPFAYYSRTETVFWPGCSLAGTSPELVLKTQQLLSRNLGTMVGIALDCCFDPVYQIGDLDAVRDASLRTKDRLERNGITSVIAACTNCVKVLSADLPGVRLRHVLDVIPVPEVSSLHGEEFYLHHPCPTYRFSAVQGRAKLLLETLGVSIVEQERPRCCGFGGNMHTLSPELADACANEVMAAAGNDPIVTYCMACKDRFLLKGARTHHLLELLVPATPVERPKSSVSKWINRFFLALSMRLRDAGRK
jgi:Fe-S oxidoreductase